MHPTMKCFVYILLGINLFAAFPLLGQQQATNPKLQAAKGQLQEAFAFSEGLWKQLKQQEENPLDIELLKTFLQDQNLFEGATDADKSYATATLKPTGDIGLKWVSDATHNFKPGIAEQEDLYFQTRLATGLDWAVLGEGSLKKRLEDEKHLRTELQLLQAAKQLEQRVPNLNQQILALQILFDAHRLGLVDKLLQLRSLQANFKKTLYQQQLISQAEQLSAETALAQTRYWQESLQGFFQSYQFPQLQAYQAISNTDLLDFSTLLQADTSYFDQQRDLLIRKQAFDQEVKAKSNADRMSLRVKLRYNYYNSIEAGDRSFASIGASLSVPLKFGESIAKQRFQILQQEELRHFDEQHALESWGQVDGKRKLLLAQQKKQVLAAEIRLLAFNLQEELVKPAKAGEAKSPLKFIEMLDHYVLKLLEMSDSRQQLIDNYIRIYFINS